MSLEIIGVGFGRTGTHSLKLALEHLGYRCYHMEELILHPEQVIHWEQARTNQAVDWDELYKGYRAAVDFPANLYYTEYLRRYPRAKYILTTRDPDSWYKSFGDTIIRQSRPGLIQMLSTMVRIPFDPLLRKRLKVFQLAGKHLQQMFKGEFKSNPDKAKQRFIEWNEKVKSTIPPEKLLVMSVKEGWKPLCDFLKVDEPDIPFPRSNTTAEFNSRTI